MNEWAAQFNLFVFLKRGQCDTQKLLCSYALNGQFIRYSKLNLMQSNPAVLEVEDVVCAAAEIVF